jgi:hypothetical protein
MIEQRLVAKLKATADITDLVGAGDLARIQPSQRMQFAEMPALIYQLLEETPCNSANAATDTSQSRIQVDIYAASYAEAKALSILVAAALNGWHDTDGCIWLLESSTYNLDGPYPADEAAAHRFTHEYLVWFSTA